jgi:hypothetical protein
VKIPCLENATLSELKRAKECAPTKEGFVRFQAMELLYEGYSRKDVGSFGEDLFREHPYG